MKRALIILGAAAVTLFAASAAEAARVSWSIGVNVAPVGAYVSSGPAWVSAPVRYAPPVVYATPAPVYAPPPVVYSEPYVEPYAEPYVVPSAAFYAAPIVVRPHHRYWAPPLPRLPWDRHDRWHHDGGFRR